MCPHTLTVTCACICTTLILSQSHTNTCRCSSFDWWICKCFQRASRSVTAVSTYTVNMKLSIPLSLPFVLSLFSPSHFCWHFSLCLSLSVFSLWLSHAGVNLSSWGLKCQLLRYSNKNKTPSHLKELGSILCYMAEWKLICSGFRGSDQRRETAATMPVPGLHFYLHTLTESSTITPEPSLKIWLA